MAVSHKLDRPLVNLSNKVCKYSTKTTTPTSYFHIGDCIRYTNEVHNEMVKIVDVNTKDTDSIKYSIKFSGVNTMIVAKEFLKSGNVPDIGSIPIYLEGYINYSKNIKQQQIENTIFSEVLSQLQQELKSWDDKLSHLHTKFIFRLEKSGVLPSIYLDLKDDVPICVSCIFVTERIRQWRNRGINKAP